VKGKGCRVKGKGCRVKGKGCRVKGEGCRVKGEGIVFRAHNISYSVFCNLQLHHRLPQLLCHEHLIGFRVYGLGFRV
jgi:hypothetical protein